MPPFCAAQRFVLEAFYLYNLRNHGLHDCACGRREDEERLLREWQCPYLEVTSLGHTVLPLGKEFQELVGMLTEDGKTDDGAAGGLAALTGVLNVFGGGGGGGGTDDRGGQDRPGDKMLAGLTAYMKGLQLVLSDPNSPDDKREAAEEACSRTVWPF